MTGERGREPDTVIGTGTDFGDQLLQTMPVWTADLLPADLVFDVSMRRRVLARVPEVLARESRRRVVRALRLVAVAAMALMVLGGVALDLRRQVPPVVAGVPVSQAAWSPGSSPERSPGLLAGRGPAGVPQRGEVTGAAEQLAGSDYAGTGQNGDAKAAPARVRFLPVLEAAPAAAKATAGAPAATSPGATAAAASAPPVQIMALPGAAGAEVREVALEEPLAFAGQVSGEAVVVSGTGRVWRYVGGYLVGGERLLPATGGAGKLVVLPGEEAPRALWVDAEGKLRVDRGPAPVSPSGRVDRLSALVEGEEVTAVLAAGTVRQQDGYEVRLWLLAWQQGTLDAAELGKLAYRAAVDPRLLDLAGFRGERGLTVYLVLAAGEEQICYLGEAGGGRLRWRKLDAPVFRPGTAVASGGILAGVDPAGREVAILEWTPGSGVTTWFRPGWYRVRRLGFPELGEALRSVYFFDTDGAGRQGLLLVSGSGKVGYVDAAVVAER